MPGTSLAKSRPARGENLVNVNVWQECSVPYIFEDNLAATMLHDILAEDFLPNLPEITDVPEGRTSTMAIPSTSRRRPDWAVLASPVPDNCRAAPPELHCERDHGLSDKVYHQSPTKKLDLVCQTKRE